MESGWNCSTCTLSNAHRNRTCDACGAERSETSQTELYRGLQGGAEGTVQQPQNAEAAQTEELRIVIIGKTGTGKSATGNSILGKSVFESKICSDSVTNKCKLGINKRFGRKIVVVDTPGLFDTAMTNDQVTKEIAKCIGMTAPGPHAILLTVNIGRFTKEEQDTVKHFVEHFGAAMYSYLIVVFTRADDLENENVDIESYVRNGPETLKTILHLCNYRYIPFNNRLRGSDQEHQVQLLITTIDGIVHGNRGCCYTNEMYEEVEIELCRQEQEMKRKLQEDEKRQIENIRRELQKEFDRKFDAVKQERDQLVNKIRENENERRWKDEARAMEANARADTDRIEQLERQMKENERRREKEFEDLRREFEQRENDLRDEYERRQNTSDLRDNNRRNCEEENDLLPLILKAAKKAFTVFSASKTCSVM